MVKTAHVQLGRVKFSLFTSDLRVQRIYIQNLEHQDIEVVPGCGISETTFVETDQEPNCCVYGNRQCQAKTDRALTVSSTFSKWVTCAWRVHTIVKLPLLPIIFLCVAV